MCTISNLADTLMQLPFKDKVRAKGGKIYAVGGAVRDASLGEEQKDLDLVITGVPERTLIKVLEEYGTANLVGQSFGVIKFREHGTGIEIDIALPRTEKKTGKRHTDFSVTVDHTLPIEKDLERRDFTINAIAMDEYGNHIDPFNGRIDLVRKELCLVNPDGFTDDPLRMLRAIQFASRFDFEFELETLASLTANVSLIDTVSKERVLMELEKIALKGNVAYAESLLVDTGMYPYIFYSRKINEAVGEPNRNYDMKSTEVKTLAELMVYLTSGIMTDVIFVDHLKGDHATAKQISALLKLYEIWQEDSRLSKHKERKIIYDALNLHKDIIINSKLFQIEDLEGKPITLRDRVGDFIQGQYPFSVRDLQINGNDILAVGIRGQAVGLTIQTLLMKIFRDEIRNDKKQLLAELSYMKAPLVDEYKEIL